jgi:hypothetical protein
MSHAKTPKPTHYVAPPNFKALNHAKQFMTFHPVYCPEIWIVWKTHSRAPRSFHVCEAEAIEAMKAFVKAGEEVSVLRAVPVARVSADITVTIHPREA